MSLIRAAKDSCTAGCCTFSKTRRRRVDSFDELLGSDFKLDEFNAWEPFRFAVFKKIAYLKGLIDGFTLVGLADQSQKELLLEELSRTEKTIFYGMDDSYFLRIRLMMHRYPKAADDFLRKEQMASDLRQMRWNTDLDFFL